MLFYVRRGKGKSDKSSYTSITGINLGIQRHLINLVIILITTHNSGYTGITGIPTIQSSYHSENMITGINLGIQPESIGTECKSTSL